MMRFPIRGRKETDCSNKEWTAVWHKKKQREISHLSLDDEISLLAQIIVFIVLLRRVTVQELEQSVSKVQANEKSERSDQGYPIVLPAVLGCHSNDRQGPIPSCKGYGQGTGFPNGSFNASSLRKATHQVAAPTTL